MLDACDAPAVQQRVAELGPQRARSLFRGAAETEHAALAPYLTTADAALCDWIGEELAAEPWGIFLFSAAPPEALYRHLRSLLRVRAPGGGALYFRFYDPRILPRLLPVCTPAELDRIFGPIDAFGFVDVELQELLLLGHSRRPLPLRVIPLPPLPAAPST